MQRQRRFPVNRRITLSLRRSPDPGWEGHIEPYSVVSQLHAFAGTYLGALAVLGPGTADTLVNFRYVTPDMALYTSFS